MEDNLLKPNKSVIFEFNGDEIESFTNTYYYDPIGNEN